MRRTLALCVSVTLAVRIAIVALVRVAPAWDGFFYARLASSLAGNGGYSVTDANAVTRPTAFYPVGYPAAIAALLRLTHDARLAVVAVNLLASIVAVTSIVFVTHRIAGARSATIAGLVYALYPGAVLWCVAAMTETLTGSLLALAMASTLSPRRVGAVGAGVALGLATLVRPQSLLLLPLVSLGARGPRAKLLAVALAALAAGAVVFPWTARNCERLDGCALVSTNGGSNLLIGTFPDAYGGYRRPTIADGCASARGEVHRDRCMSAMAIDRIREHPWRWLSLAPMKLLVTFAWEHDPVSYARGRDRSSPTSAPVAIGIALLSATWWSLIALSWRATRSPTLDDSHAALLRFVLGAVAIVVLTHALFLGADRYHLILVPLLAPLAAIGLTARGRAS